MNKLGFLIGITALALIGFVVWLHSAQGTEVCPPNLHPAPVLEQIVQEAKGTIVKIEAPAAVTQFFNIMTTALGPFSGPFQPTAIWIIDVPPEDGTVMVAYQVGQCTYRPWDISRNVLEGIILGLRT